MPHLASVVAPILAFDFGTLVIIIIFVIFMVISGIAENAKKKEVEQRRKQQQQQRQQQRRERLEEVEGDSDWEAPPSRPTPAREWERRETWGAEQIRSQTATAREARARAEAARARKAQPSVMAGDERKPAEEGEGHGMPAFELGHLERDDLARAIVLAEVLGPPVALRDDPSRREGDMPHRLI